MPVLDQDERWSRERPDIDTWPIGVVGRIMRISRMWDKEIKDFLAEYDLEPGEFDVLSTLRRSGAPYELTAGAFLKASLVRTGTITLRVGRMHGGTCRPRAAVAVANEARLLRSLGRAEREALAATLTTLLESYGDTPDSRSAPGEGHGAKMRA